MSGRYGSAVGPDRDVPILSVLDLPAVFAKAKLSATPGMFRSKNGLTSGAIQAILNVYARWFAFIKHSFAKVNQGIYNILIFF